jgi:hypothetical protein
LKVIVVFVFIQSPSTREGFRMGLLCGEKGALSANVNSENLLKVIVVFTSVLFKALPPGKGLGWAFVRRIRRPSILH